MFYKRADSSRHFIALTPLLIDIFPQSLVGLPVDAMKRYVEFVADQLLQSMGYMSVFDVKNPVRTL